MRPRKRRKTLCSEKLCIDWFVAPGNDSSEVDTFDFTITIIIVVSAVVKISIKSHASPQK